MSVTPGEQLGAAKALYHYSPKNRITALEQDLPGFLGRRHERELHIEYAYDPFGRRSGRSATAGRPHPGNGRARGLGGERVERYLYDGLSFEVLAELCEEGRSEEERSNRWAPSKRRSVTCEYQRAGGRLIGRSEYEGEGRNRHRERVQKHYYLQDVLGSVVALSDERGHERQRCAYDAWGGEYERRGPGRNGNGHHHLWQQGPHEGTRYGYTGKRLDRPAGLYDYGFRDYKPRISRWTTVDPIRDGRNWYSYVENDPVNRIDPLGLLSDEGNTSGSAEEPSAFEQAIEKNTGFTRDHSACDEYVTVILEDSGKKPDDWPDPKTHKVGPNKNETQNYMDKLETTDTAEEGVSAVMMSGGDEEDEHMAGVEKTEDGSVTATDYSGGEVHTKEYSSQKEFENDDWVYDNFSYYSVE
ncbi:MAG: RHS repeat-associated core domain-containing protein [Spirochaetia bacterium]